MARHRKAARHQVGLRVSEDMRVRLEKAAEKGDRSINSEILERLERSFEAENRFGGPRATALVEAIGHGMMAGGECAGSYKFGKLGHYREWLDFQIPFDRAAKVALTILELNRPTVDGAPPLRTAAEAIERTGVEAVEQSAAEVERQAERAASDGPAPSMEPSAMWDRAIRRAHVEHGFTPPDEVSTPEGLREKIRRTYEDLGALLAALDATNPEEKK